MGVGGVARLGADVVVQGGAASRTGFVSVETMGISLVTRTSIPTDYQQETKYLCIYIFIYFKKYFIKHFLLQQISNVATISPIF